MPTSSTIGIGGGFFGGVAGTITKGDVMGQINSGELFAQYNQGDTYTTGKNVELVRTDNSVTALYAVTSMNAVIYNKGVVTLVNGMAFVPFEGNYAALLGEAPVVTASPNSDCNGVYVYSVTKEGFYIKEIGGGTSNATISWIAVGNRIDDAIVSAATKMVTDPSFDRNVAQVLYSDGNLEGAAMGMWWDGTSVQFGKIPAELSATKR